MGAHALAPCTSVAVGYACAGPQVETRSPPHRSDRDRRVRGRLRAGVRGAGHRLDPPPDRSPLVLLVLEPADDRAGGKGGAPSAPASGSSTPSTSTPRGTSSTRSRQTSSAPAGGRRAA